VRNINKKSAVFVFDEIDKMEEHDFIYMILEEVYRKSIIMITNFNEWATGLDQRIKSRLLPERIDFRKYSKEEIKGILEQRMEYAFVDGVWEKEAFELVANKTYEIGDVRIGLNLMKEAGLCAEDKASKKIEICHIEKAMEKLKDFSIKDKKNLDVESKKILELAKENSGQKIGDLFKKSQEKGDDINYKSFQRKIKKLSDDGFIETEKKVGGAEGTTTIIKTDKKLTDY
jgi:cell division control protein 6